MRGLNLRSKRKPDLKDIAIIQGLCKGLWNKKPPLERANEGFKLF